MEDNQMMNSAAAENNPNNPSAANNPFYNYDFAAWYGSAKALLNKRVKITQAQNPFQNELGYINDVISPDQGRSWNRVLVLPDRDQTQLIELGQGDYVIQQP